MPQFDKWNRNTATDTDELLRIGQAAILKDNNTTNIGNPSATHIHDELTDVIMIPHLKIPVDLIG